MKIFKYWVSEIFEQRDSDIGKTRIWAGSNVSEEEARSHLQENFDALKLRIKHQMDESYECSIREEVLQTLDEHNVITRNRYGAEVMNSEVMQWIDIDKPKFCLRNLFSRKDPREKMTNDVICAARSPELALYTFRIYWTARGIRVAALGCNYAARDNQTALLFKQLNADALYAQLCRKQNCYRARLTPKPWNMAMAPIRVQFPIPLDNPNYSRRFERFLSRYNATMKNFAVCRYIQTLNPNTKLESHPVITFHDKRTRAFEKDLPLA